MKKLERLISLSSSISYLFCFRLFLLTFLRKEGDLLFPFSLFAGFLLSFTTRKKREQRHRFGAENGEGSCLLICLSSTHERLKGDSLLFSSQPLTFPT